ncbi:MAG: CDP-alcohol phosphatidyltransferase family protein [candidate division WOR-3 bacterium]
MSKKFTISNAITIFRFLLLPFIIYFLIKKERIIAFIIMLVALFSDVIDGYIARKFHQESDLGKVLDPLCDKISLAIILLTLLLINSVPLWAVIIIAVRDILILAGSYVLFRQKRTIYKSNFFGKITGFLFGLMILAFTLNYQKLGMIALYISIPFMVGAFITYYQRFILAIRKNN